MSQNSCPVSCWICNSDVFESKALNLDRHIVTTTLCLSAGTVVFIGQVWDLKVISFDAKLELKNKVHSKKYSACVDLKMCSNSFCLQVSMTQTRIQSDKLLVIDLCLMGSVSW